MPTTSNPDNLPSIPRFRVRLDVPYSFAAKPGFVRDTHCHNFREDDEALVNCCRDPNTGLVMMTPAFFSSGWYENNNWEPLTRRLTDEGYWHDVFRAVNPDAESAAARFFSAIPKPDNSDYGQTLANIARAIGLSPAYISDVLRPVSQSLFSLAPDEGFVLHCHFQGDEMHRPNNLIQVNFGDLALHISGTGLGSVYQFPNGLTGDPILIDRFAICAPGDLILKSNFFMVVPIPGYGLSITHSLSGQRLDHRASSAQAGVSRGRLVKIDRADANGYKYVHPGGQVILFAPGNIKQHSAVLGFLRLRYGDVLDTRQPRFKGEIFDIGYAPSHDPAAVAALTLPVDPARGTSAIAAVRERHDVRDWSFAESDRKGRVCVSLFTSDDRYTPFLNGTGVAWNPEFYVRDTVSVDPDALWRLEFTDDENGCFSGSCVTLMESEANKRLVERGDTTFVVERSDDEGLSWMIQGGGIAQISGQATVNRDAAGEYYVATWELSGMEKRFSEIHKIDPVAFDKLLISEAVNTVLTMSALPTIDYAAFPPAFANLQLPEAKRQEDWRWGTKAGQSGLEIINLLLLLLRKQEEAYRLRWDWEQQKWIAEAKPRDLSGAAAWTATPFPDELDTETGRPERTILIGDGSDVAVTFLVQPPEANLIVAIGLTEVNNLRSETVRSPGISNPDSYDKTSPDYLGRCVEAFPLFAPVSEQGDIDIMARRVFDAAAHRRLLLTVKGNRYYHGFKPLTRVFLRGDNRQGERMTAFGGQDFWVKKRTITIEYNQESDSVIHAVYNLDSVWEEMI